jgi:hypothetical protein
MLSWSRNLAFMEPEGSLPCLHESATGPDSEADESIPHLQTYFPKISCNMTVPGYNLKTKCLGTAVTNKN